MTLFRRINGRIVPIKEASMKAYRAGTLVGAVERPVIAGGVIAAIKKPKQVTPNRWLQATGFAASVADGLVSGATFLKPGAKAFFGGAAVSIGLSAGSTAANVASFAGRGHFRARAKGIVRQEAINTIAGYGTMAATLLAIPSSRQKIIAGAAKVLGFVGRKAKLVL